MTRRYALLSDDGRRRTFWLDTVRPCRAGTVLRLEGEDGVWTVNLATSAESIPSEGGLRVVVEA